MKKYLFGLVLLAFTLPSSAQFWFWGRSPVNKTNSVVAGNAVATDKFGNSVFAGSFVCDTMRLGLFNLIGASVGSSNMFVVQYDANGSLLWASGAGGTSAGNDAAYAVCTDSAGSIYVAGAFHSPTIKFGTVTLNRVANDDIFLVKYSNTGTVRWAKSIGGTGADDALALCSDNMHHIYMTGFFSSTSITLGSTTLTNTQSGTNDIFIAQYDTSGTLNWAKSAGGTGADKGTAISADRIGNVYLTGTFASASMMMGTSTLLNTASSNLFIAKYDVNGNVLWATAPTGPGFASGTGISADSSGDTYFTGNFGTPSVTFGTTTLQDTGASDICVGKYDSNGNLRWVKRVGGRQADVCGGIHFDGVSNSFITGTFFSDTLNFGTTHLNCVGAGTYDMFIAKYDTLGNVEWATVTGASGSDYGNAVTTNHAGDAFVAGSLSAPSVNMGSSTVTNIGTQNAIFGKMSGPALGIQTYSMETGSVVVFPNPSRETVTLRLTKTPLAPFDLVVYNQSGQEVRHLTRITSSEIPIQKENLSTGMYYFLIRDEESRILGRGKILFME